MSLLGPAEDEVHVWWATLSVTDEELETLEPLLSADERRRATRYLIPAVRRRYIVARGILRTLLGWYLGVDAADVELEYGQAGKPRPAARLGSDLMFNLSHSGHVAAYALCRKTEIGVDIEQVDKAIDTTAIVSTMFSASQREKYRALSDAEKRLALYLAWTRKEAYLKGLGCGLTGSLEEIHMADPHGWSVEDLAIDDGWVGALAVQREEWQLTISRWHPLERRGDMREESGHEGGSHGMQEMWLRHQPGTAVVPRVLRVAAVGGAA